MWVAVAGNVLFVLWALYNGVSEGFRGTPPEVVSMIGLVALLILDTVFLVTKGPKWQR
jgi:hypothetical protein